MKKGKKSQNSKEYLEYLIFEKDILKLKNIALLLIIIGSIAIISLQIFKQKTSNTDDGCGEGHSKEHMEEMLVEAGYSYNEIEKLSYEELIDIYHTISKNNKGQYAGKFTNKEYPKEDASILKQNYYIMASKGDFDSIVKDFEDKKLKYFFSQSYNKELITIYNDAYYLRNIIGEGRQANNFNVKETLASIKDPQMLLYGTLLSEEKYRRDTLTDIFSLSPILIKKHVRVDSIFSTSMSSVQSLDKDKKDSRFNEMAKYLGEGNFTFYKFDFTIDNNNLTAYIYKNINNFKLSFYGIYSNSDYNPYLRVYDFIQMENSIIQNNSNTNNNSYNNSPTVNVEKNDIQEDNSSIDGPHIYIDDNENIPIGENQENSTTTNKDFNLD